MHIFALEFLAVSASYLGCTFALERKLGLDAPRDPLAAGKASMKTVCSLVTAGFHSKPCGRPLTTTTRTPNAYANARRHAPNWCV